MADDDTTPQPTGPVMQLLASGLQYWIRQQCEAVESLELQLHGSALALLRGRLEGVTLVARRVVFSSLDIEMVELRSAAIQVQVGKLLKGQALLLEHPFEIRGYAAFTGPGLSRSLSTPHWRSLGDALVDGLMGLSPLQSLQIERDRLVIAAQGRRCDTVPRGVDGTLELRTEANDHTFRLPSDPNIRIEEANLEGGMLQLHGTARVSP